MSIHKFVYAAGHGQTTEFTKLLNSGIDINQTSTTWHGHTAMTIASQRGNENIIQGLLDRGASVNVFQAGYLWTPLHYACAWDNLRLVELFLAAGADVRIKNKDGMTPLHLAFQRGKEAICDVLLRRGADPHIVDNTERTAWDCCSNQEMRARLELLYEDINPSVLK